MSIVSVVTVAARVAAAVYKIVAFSILMYYLIKETVQRELRGRSLKETLDAHPA